MRIDMIEKVEKIIRGKRNKTAKKICCAVLAAVIVIMGFPHGLYKERESIVYADNMKYTIGNSTYTYYVTTNNTVTITGYAGTDTKIKIPERIEGKEVTGIGAATFYQGSNLVEIVIPKSVNEIEPLGIGLFCAFDGCTQLKAIYVEEGNQYYKSLDGVLYRYRHKYEIGNANGMTMLCYPQNREDSTFILPKDVTYIFGGAFDGSSNLKEIIVEEGNTRYKSVDGVLFDTEQAQLVCYPSNKDNDVYVVQGEVYSIGRDAFSACKNLVKIIISDGVDYIEGGGIKHCEKLTEITIPKSLEWNNGAFCSGCTSLKLINIEEGNPRYKSIDGILFSADGTEIVRYLPNNDNISYEIPQGVEYIRHGTFDSCTNLRRLIIPNSVSYIGNGAFDECVNLTICGEKNSYAQTFAENNNIPFCVIEELISDDNIMVIYNADDEMENLTLSTKKLSSADDKYKIINFTGKIIDETILPSDIEFMAYDITLLDERENVVQPNDMVLVKIPCLSEYDKTKCKVYRVEKNGTFTDMRAVCQNGYLVFETNHFSTYIITETKLISNSSISFGDVNGDGELDIKDSALIKNYLAGWETEMDGQSADLDGDGEVTIKDSALIRRRLAGW